ncbi:MAG: alcohol dehydrogenase [Alphaproteobacteria bacterium]|nr:MAG: alcohol dehydrogenase [Alphaproteobacteria bacterium]
MRAMVLTGHGGFDKYSWRTDWPRPEPGPGEVRIRVHACGLNNTDVNTRLGWYAPEVRDATSAEPYDAEIEAGSWSGVDPFPRIQGADICGVVEAVGPGADSALLGRRVLVDDWVRDPAAPDDLEKARFVGSELDGGFADYVVVPAANAVPVESPLSDAELATFPCSGATAEGMLSRAGVREGQWVLVTGASGGVGNFLVQLARRRGARVVALASPDKHEMLGELGAEVCLPRSPRDLAGALRARIGQPVVDVVADVVGGAIFPTLLSVIRRGGAYVTSGAIAGPVVELDLRTLYLHDLTLHGSTVTSAENFRNLVSYIERGEVRPTLAATWPLEELVAAQKAFLAKKHVGKIVVTMVPEATERHG